MRDQTTELIETLELAADIAKLIIDEKNEKIAELRSLLSTVAELHGDTWENETYTIEVNTQKSFDFTDLSQ